VISTRAAEKCYPETCIIKHFTLVIYPPFHGNTVILCCKAILPFNYHGKEVNYQDKKFHNIGPWWQTYTAVIYRGNLTLENAEN